MDLVEEPISWAHLLHAEQAALAGSFERLEENPFKSDETSAVIELGKGDKPVCRNIRDWLFDYHIGEFDVFGCAVTDYMYTPFGPVTHARFRFATFDDKLLFTLRWC